MTRKVSVGTNCQRCVDCQPMVQLGIHTMQPLVYLFRCYGDDGGAPLKRDFAKGREGPPQRAPAWCPNRKRKKGER